MAEPTLTQLIRKARDEAAQADERAEKFKGPEVPRIAREKAAEAALYWNRVVRWLEAQRHA